MGFANNEARWGDEYKRVDADAKQPVTLTYVDTTTRLVFTRFVLKFLRTGELVLHESWGDGTPLHFRGRVSNECNLKSEIRVLSPAFYWKVVTRQDLGLADAYIDGDFEFLGDGAELLNFFLLLIANRDLIEKDSLSRSWWNPFILSSAFGTAVSYFQHVLRHNSLTNARRNISRHYDLSNDMFKLFLGESMQYSSAIFKGPPEECLFDAQMRKINLLIEKGKVESSHEVLDIGCGWGAFAIQLVRRTGCTYLGITLSQEQLEYAQAAVKEADLEHKITIQLMDYRAVPGYQRFDRIFSVEMLEHVGHEYLKAWFQSCDRLLAKDGLLVLQFISIADGKYDAYRTSTDFIREYIFPGGCLPAFSTVTAAMAAGSSLCVQHVENIGPHYCETLLRWQHNFQKNRSQVLKLGFGEKFIRTWDYYFFYCAAGFKSCTLGDLQIVFSRPGNVAVLGSLSVSFPSSRCNTVQHQLQQSRCN